MHIRFSYFNLPFKRFMRPFGSKPSSMPSFITESFLFTLVAASSIAGSVIAFLGDCCLLCFGSLGDIFLNQENFSRIAVS